ncbi:MAG: hypothetical protein K0S10_2253 [Rubrobacteraceae bacterium]|nr:hypothetical protein [Rubrobacteraceae bacterium]
MERCQHALPEDIRTYNRLKVHFSTTVGQEPRLEVALY